MRLNLFKNRTKTIGLSPGSFVHIGEQKTEQFKVWLIDYDQQHLQSKELEQPEDAFPFKTSPTVSWLNITGLHEVDKLKQLADYFDIHPLVMEDILNTAHQPKTEIYDNYIFTIIKMIRFDSALRELVSEQVSIILGPSFVITFQEREGDLFEPVRKRLNTLSGRLRKYGPDYLMYALLDVIVDNYYLILQHISEMIESYDEMVLERPDEAAIREIHQLKRTVLLLRNSIWPLRQAVYELMGGENDLIQEKTMPYLRDVYDHAIQVVETVEIFREMISGIIDLHMTNVSNRMNEVMKVLTIIATIFIPLTFIAGIYGMNFEYMPELKWPLGYALVWMVMSVVALGLVIFFRKRKWL